MEFCDMNCRYAEWPKDKALDGSSSCRTFQAIFCRKKEQVVHKNGPCMEKKKRSAAKTARRAGKRTDCLDPPLPRPLPRGERE